MPIELGALNQTHRGWSSLPRPQGVCKQPIVSTGSHRAKLIFDPIVVDWQLPIIQKLRQCHPALLTGIECFSGV